MLSWMVEQKGMCLSILLDACEFDDEESRRDVADICTSFAIGDLVQPISTAL